MPKAKENPIFVCNACGNESPKWEGKCPACGQWNTLAEVRRDRPKGRNLPWSAASAPALQELAQMSTASISRLKLTSEEVNRVLGGGIVPGSVTLIAGDPGIGKSTLLLSLASDIASSTGKTLYISGEESAAQVKMRCDRLGLSGRNMFILPATDLAEVLGHLDGAKPALAIVDSIQTVYDSSLPSEAGGAGQIRESTRQLIQWAKSCDVPIVMSGHVTKGGDIAGPRVLEHMVDVVLYLEGDPISALRLLTSIKNRFGSTNEVGVFEMGGSGLVDVEDPSREFLSGRREGAVGSVVISTLEGSRPLLAEIQALTSPSVLPTPRRVTTGIDFNRLLLVCAVLARRAGISLANQDIVVNVAGGLRVKEPAADLGLGLAIVSSLRDRPIEPGIAAIGEVGLSGEVRKVPQLDRRVREAARLGLGRCLLPVGPWHELASQEGLQLVPVSNVAEAIRACFPSGKADMART